MNPTVRPAEIDDAPAVAEMANALHHGDGPVAAGAMTAEIVRRDLLGPGAWAVLLVAVIDGRVVGFVTGSPLYDAENGCGGTFMLNLYVRPEARRRGAGRALMAGMAAETARRGGRCLWWTVANGDEAALRFYASLGAEDDGLLHGRLLGGDGFKRLVGGGA